MVTRAIDRKWLWEARIRQGMISMVTRNGHLKKIPETERRIGDKDE